MTRSEATKSTAAEQLVDIRDVKIDRSLPSEERIKSFIEQIKNPYQFKVGNTVVRVSFANTQNTTVVSCPVSSVTRIFFYCTPGKNILQEPKKSTRR